MVLASDNVWNSASYWSEPAERAFAAARRRARRESFKDRLRGRRSTLLSFHSTAKTLHLLPASTDERLSVPVSAIVGSVDKWRFFSRSFLPLSDSLIRRWKGAYAVAHGLRGYEPVELYEVAGSLYVVDGHFRVSVARALGSETIQATVRHWA